MIYDAQTHAKLAAILSHKKIFERGITAYLKGIFTGVGVVSTYDAADISTPCISVDFEAGAVQNKTVKTPLTGWHEDYIFSASLAVQYISRRESDPTAHFDFVAKLRAAFCAGFIMDSDNLPLDPLLINQIDFAGEASAYDDTYRADITALSFDLNYMIRPTAFDAGA